MNKFLSILTLLPLTVCSPVVAQEVPEPRVTMANGFVYCDTESKIINEYVNIDDPFAEGCFLQQIPISVIVTPLYWIDIRNSKGYFNYLIGSLDNGDGELKYAVVEIEKIEEEDA